MTTFRIAFFADSHLGYRAYDRANAKGVNLRVQDGYDALKEIIVGIVREHQENPIDAVVHGGDFFHTSHPSIRDIMMAQHFLRQLNKHKIPFYGLAGNHDASDNRTDVAAVGVLDDPDREIFALYEPYKTYNLNEQIILHSVAHHGHKDERAPELQTVSSKINIFTTHGAAVDPKNATLMRCMDSPREQIIPPEMVLSDEFSIRLLGHYHSRYAVGGEALKTWYAGSALRRGFSDDPGDRGWLLVTVHEDGSVDVDPRNISQRPQQDFEIIDASEMTSEEIQDMILSNIESTRNMELEGQFDEAHAPILRQRVINATRAVREGIDRALLAKKAAHALRWQLEFMRPSEKPLIKNALTEEEQKQVEEAQARALSIGKNSGSVDIEEQFLDWATKSKTLAQTAKEERRIVGEEGRRHLKDAAEKEIQ